MGGQSLSARPGLFFHFPLAGMSLCGCVWWRGCSRGIRGPLTTCHIYWPHPRVSKHCHLGPHKQPIYYSSAMHCNSRSMEDRTPSRRGRSQHDLRKAISPNHTTQEMGTSLALAPAPAPEPEPEPEPVIQYSTLCNVVGPARRSGRDSTYLVYGHSAYRFPGCLAIL